MLTVTYSDETIKTVDRALRFHQPEIPLSTSRPILVQPSQMDDLNEPYYEDEGFFEHEEGNA